MPAPRARQQDKPAGVGINLDTLERDTPDVEPFIAVIGGKRFKLAPADEVEWRIVSNAMRDPAPFINAAVDPKELADFTKLIGSKPSWMINELIGKWTEHYGLPASPEADASPDS